MSEVIVTICEQLGDVPRAVASFDGVVNVGWISTSVPSGHGPLLLQQLGRNPRGLLRLWEGCWLAADLGWALLPTGTSRCLSPDLCQQAGCERLHDHSRDLPSPHTQCHQRPPVANPGLLRSHWRRVSPLPVPGLAQLMGRRFQEPPPVSFQSGSGPQLAPGPVRWAQAQS